MEEQKNQNSETPKGVGVETEVSAQTFTFDEAMNLMKCGKKMTHRYFAIDEWMTIDGKCYEFEDGNKATPEEFWTLRIMIKGWQNGWTIFAH